MLISEAVQYPAERHFAAAVKLSKRGREAVTAECGFPIGAIKGVPLIVDDSISPSLIRFVWEGKTMEPET